METTWNEATIDVFMPGRLCILGEHSDWASSYQTENPKISDGAALVLGLNKGIYLKARKSNRLIYHCTLEKLPIFIECSMDLNPLQEEMNKTDLGRYVVSTVRILKELYDIDGLEMECYKIDLPIKKGLSSSAAICMAVIRAANQLYQLHLPVEKEMQLAWQAERDIGSQCGKMDQVCACGNKLVNMKFVRNEVFIEEIDTDIDLNILIVDLQGKKDTRKILADLNSHYPYPADQQDEHLHDALGKINLQMVQQAAAALKEGNIEEIGRLMGQAQQIFDRYVAILSPVELEAKRLHELLADPFLQPFVHGGKGVGSQGDGSAQFLLKSEADTAMVESYIQRKYGYETFLVSTRPSETKQLAAAGFIR
ncbi:mevalonate kinase family protein [Neobacillus sp. Marseille-QA0830]